MADCQINNASSDKFQIPAADDSSIIEHITKTIIELNTCRKIVFMYPPEHVQVQRSLKRACDILNQAMRSQPELIIGIAKDALLVGGKPLDPKNTICKDFAFSLMQHEVAAIKFLSDVTTTELLRFLLLIAEKPDDIQARGGLQKISSDGSLSKIQIQAIDYGKFQFTEEAEIAGADKDDGHTAKKTVWQNYIVHLISGSLSESNDGKSLSEFGDVDPVQMAELLNRDQKDQHAVLGAYHEALKNLADQISTRHCPSLPCEQTDENPNPAVFSSTPVGNLQNLNRLLRELNPDLRQQFLAVTFQLCNTESASNWADEFLRNFSEDLVLDMLQQASKTGKEISPTLLGFVEKLTSAEMPPPTEPAPIVNDPVGDRHPSHNSPENLPGLFQRESDEDFVVTEYNTLLNGLTQEKQTEKTDAKKQLADQNILESMEDSRLCDKIAMLLLLFMKTDHDAEKYRAYAAKLVDIGNELLEASHFPLLLAILNRFKQHYREPVGKEIQTVAKESIQSWQDPAFTSKAVKTIMGSRDRIDPKAYDFLIALGPQIVPDLINAYGKQKNSEADESLFKLLTKFKDPAVKEAQKRLRDPRPEYVYNLVAFLRRINAREALPQLRSLMETSNSSVQMAVLATLLKFGDGWALYHLRNSIQSDQADIASRSIAMAAKYKFADIVPDLLAMLKTRVFFKSDFQKNEELIAALGQIGDTGAIPTLEKLAKNAGLFHQEEQLHMKLGLYASLKGYPLDAVSTLLKSGQRSKEKSIRDVCRKTLTGANPCSN